MKNKFAILLVGTLLIAAVLGCGLNPFSDKGTTANSNKSLTDKGIDTVVGEEKIGVPECDEVMDMLTAEMNNPDDGYIAKAGKAFVLNKIKQSIKDSVEKNKNDKTELAKNCTEFKKELVKYKADEEKKKGQ